MENKNLKGGMKRMRGKTLLTALASGVLALGGCSRTENVSNQANYQELEEALNRQALLDDGKATYADAKHFLSGGYTWMANVEFPDFDENRPVKFNVEIIPGSYSNRPNIYQGHPQDGNVYVDLTQNMVKSILDTLAEEHKTQHTDY